MKCLSIYHWCHFLILKKLPSDYKDLLNCSFLYPSFSCSFYLFFYLCYISYFSLVIFTYFWFIIFKSTFFYFGWIILCKSLIVLKFFYTFPSIFLSKSSTYFLHFYSIVIIPEFIHPFIWSIKSLAHYLCYFFVKILSIF